MNDTNDTNDVLEEFEQIAELLDGRELYVDGQRIEPFEVRPRDDADADD